jgi:hypothetical protein
MAGKPAKADKEAQKAAKREKRAASRMRYKQLWQAFQHQRREDKLLLPLMIGTIVLAAALAFGIGLFFGMEWVLLPLGIAVGLLGAVSIFGRRVQNSVYAKADGQPGAAGWALDNMRGSWRVSQGIAGNTHLDAVHRVIGRPGVILVAEGAPHRVKSLLAQEKKRTSRVVGSTPIYDFVVGNDEGQTPLRDLQKTLTKLPRNISTNQMEEIEKRLACAGFARRGLAEGSAALRREDAQRPAHGAAPLAGAHHHGAAARSCQPRPSTSRTSGGTTTAISAVRSSTMPGPTAARPPTESTRRPSTVIPALAPNAATGTAVRTNQTPRTNHPNQGLTAGSGVANIAAMPYPMNQSMVSAANRRPNPATEPDPAAGRPSPFAWIGALDWPVRSYRCTGHPRVKPTGHGLQSRLLSSVATDREAVNLCETAE